MGKQNIPAKELYWFRKVKQQLCTCAALFLVHFFAVTLHDTKRKCVTSGFVEDVNTKRRLSFSFPQPPYSFLAELQKTLPAFNEMK